MVTAKEVSAMRDAGDVKGLVAALTDHFAFVRWRACRALADMGDTTALEPLMKLFEDPDYEVASAAGEAVYHIHLRELGPEGLKKHLMEERAKEPQTARSAPEGQTPNATFLTKGPGSDPETGPADNSPPPSKGPRGLPPPPCGD